MVPWLCIIALHLSVRTVGIGIQVHFFETVVVARTEGSPPLPIAHVVISSLQSQGALWAPLVLRLGLGMGL